MSDHGETGEDTRRNPRMEPGSGKRRSLWTASSRKTGPKWVWKRLVELSTMSLGSTHWANSVLKRCISRRSFEFHVCIDIYERKAHM